MRAQHTRVHNIYIRIDKIHRYLHKMQTFTDYIHAHVATYHAYAHTAPVQDPTISIVYYIVCYTANGYTHVDGTQLCFYSDR